MRESKSAVGDSVSHDGAAVRKFDATEHFSYLLKDKDAAELVSIMSDASDSKNQDSIFRSTRLPMVVSHASTLKQLSTGALASLVMKSRSRDGIDELVGQLKKVYEEAQAQPKSETSPNDYFYERALKPLDDFLHRLDGEAWVDAREFISGCSTDLTPDAPLKPVSGIFFTSYLGPSITRKGDDGIVSKSDIALSKLVQQAASRVCLSTFVRSMRMSTPGEKFEAALLAIAKKLATPVLTSDKFRVDSSEPTEKLTPTDDAAVHMHLAADESDSKMRDD